ncbi:MAG: M20/M25/M40 family metallo-hydrolase [Deltaproteobacteria bacterium]|nr:M20/M25/M40 family metallo-hydrolase [Deltaproteobacteria bacterium]
MRREDLFACIEQDFDHEILPTLSEYIAIPNKSPAFDPEWEKAGHMQRAAELIAAWCRRRKIEGLKVDLIKEPGRTPLLLMDVPARGLERGEAEPTVLIYGHLDKQPEMVGWSEGLAPFKPVLRGDKLFGRGGADDGYAAFAALSALSALEQFGAARPRAVVVIEGSEESGSSDLLYYVDALSDRIGTPQLVICLDSGCGDYERLWCTTSLRGIVAGDLRVEILSEGVHSGDAGGIVPSTFRIARQLLTRIEDEATGVVRVEGANVSIPEERVAQAALVGEVLGHGLYSKFPFVPGAQPSTSDLAELVLRRTWRPALEVTGASGLPALEHAGSVARPQTTLRLSLRIPPTADASAVCKSLKATLEAEPPYNARVSFDGETASGWNAPATKPWLAEALDQASRRFFGPGVAHNGEGGSIPFMSMLGQRFPDAQFVVTGVLGPQSNAHGPNEFLHIPTAKKVTASVASVLADMAIAAKI